MGREHAWGRRLRAESYLLVERAQPLHLGLDGLDALLQVLVGLFESGDVLGR